MQLQEASNNIGYVLGRRRISFAKIDCIKEQKQNTPKRF